MPAVVLVVRVRASGAGSGGPGPPEGVELTAGCTWLRCMHVMTDARLRIGEVAQATGVTVRTLRHYDALGLLVPSERTSSGYRLYGEPDLRRLYRILALRRVGFGLDDIAAALDADGDDPRPTVRLSTSRSSTSTSASPRRSAPGSRASSTCSTVRTS